MPNGATSRSMSAADGRHDRQGWPLSDGGRPRSLIGEFRRRSPGRVSAGSARGVGGTRNLNPARAASRTLIRTGRHPRTGQCRHVSVLKAGIPAAPPATATSLRNRFHWPLPHQTTGTVSCLRRGGVAGALPGACLIASGSAAGDSAIGRRRQIDGHPLRQISGIGDQLRRIRGSGGEARRPDLIAGALDSHHPLQSLCSLPKSCEDGRNRLVTPFNAQSLTVPGGNGYSRYHASGRPADRAAIERPLRVTTARNQQRQQVVTRIGRSQIAAQCGSTANANIGDIASGAGDIRRLCFQRCPARQLVQGHAAADP